MGQYQTITTQMYTIFVRMSMFFLKIFHIFFRGPAGSPKLCRHACNFVLSPAIYHVSPL